MEITLFTTTTCHECVPIKEYLDAQHLLYEEKLVDRDNNAAKEMVEKTGQRSVPVVVVTKENGTEQTIIGHDMGEIIKAISDQ